jgi:hypothetical protein
MAHPLPSPDRPQPAEHPVSREPEPSTISEKAITDFTRVVEQCASHMELIERG